VVQVRVVVPPLGTLVGLAVSDTVGDAVVVETDCLPEEQAASTMAALISTEAAEPLLL
jgi:hypothetical protein